MTTTTLPILVPLDGSPFSASALPLAVAIARRAGTSLHLVHVHDRPRQLLGAPATDLRLDVEIEHRMKRDLELTAGQLRAETGLLVETTLLESDGRAGPALAAFLHTSPAQLIVMSSHHGGGVRRLWKGSVADALARESGVPLLIAKPLDDATPSPIREPPFGDVLLPLDGSALAEEIAEDAVALGEPGHTTYTLLRVLTPFPVLAQPAPAPPSMVDSIEIERQRGATIAEFDRVAQKIGARGFRTERSVVVDVQPAKAILAFAATHPTDLIALSTHGHGGLARAVLGSVADKVLRGAKVAVLIRHPVSIGRGASEAGGELADTGPRSSGRSS